MGKFVDSIIAYRILTMLTTPFVETNAYKLGIIDAKGKELRPMRNLNTVEERDAYTLLHRMVYRIKRIIERVPIENKKLASYAAALSLVREAKENNYEITADIELKFAKKLLENLDTELNEVNTYLTENKILNFKQYQEEIIANTSSVSPIGVALTNKGTEPSYLDTTIAVRKKPKMIRRKQNV